MKEKEKIEITLREDKIKINPPLSPDLNNLRLA